MTAEELDAILTGKEDEHLECKEAKNNYEFEELVDYCVALANERGGRMVLGVTNAPPRRVVGSQAFRELERTKAGLLERLHFRVDAEELNHPGGRLVIFRIPSRTLGMPLHDKGTYWMRSGESLVPMSADQLKRIFDEAGPDYSAEMCARTSMRDIDHTCLEGFRSAWHRKSGNEMLLRLSPEQLLADAGLMSDGRLNYAALILVGTPAALSRYLPQAEIIFEYRSSESSVALQQRKEFRAGFLGVANEIWSLINLRNDIQHYQEGLFVWDVRTFDESVVREAVLNAVSHRDYRHAGSVFVRQFPRSLEVVSPGGFPEGINPGNVLWRQLPRNRRLAEVLEKCGLVERSGQGMNRMFERCLSQGKARPDFGGTDDFQVQVRLSGEIQDARFLAFLERVANERQAPLYLEDLLILDLVNREQPVGQQLKGRLPFLVEQGVIEKIGRGRATRYILSRRFHAFLGKKGAYTRKHGLDRETNKELLRRHIWENRADGARLQDLLQVLPALSRGHVQGLLRDLAEEGKIVVRGQTRAGRWYPGG